MQSWQQLATDPENHVSRGGIIVQENLNFSDNIFTFIKCNEIGKLLSILFNVIVNPSKILILYASLSKATIVSEEY